MVERAPQDPDSQDEYEQQYQRLSESSDAHKSAWERTLEDMERMAEEREMEGYDAVTVTGHHTAPEALGDDSDPDDDFGLVYVIPKNEAETFYETVEAGEFPDYTVYRNVVDNRVFMVTELVDEDNELVVFVAGNFWRHEAEQLRNTVRDREEMYTHLQKLDGTQVGTFHHAEYEPFFPNA